MNIWYEVRELVTVEGSNVGVAPLTVDALLFQGSQIKTITYQFMICKQTIWCTHTEFPHYLERHLRPYFHLEVVFVDIQPEPGNPKSYSSYSRQSEQDRGPHVCEACHRVAHTRVQGFL